MTFTYRGQYWRMIGPPVATSDHFLLATAVLLDADGNEAMDADGFIITHTFFMGAQHV